MNYNFLKKNKIHIFFFLILSLNYIFPLIFFGKITLFYHDALDSEIVYNNIIGKIYRKEYPNIELFLNGEIKIEYLRRLFFPISLLYYFFTTEVSYWITDILVKLTSYCSFFILSKKINKNKFSSCLIAALFASINYRTLDGLGIAIFPYLLYLILFKQKYNLKHFLLIFIFGLNTDFATCVPQIPIVFLLSIILNEENKRLFKNFLLVFLVFFISIILGNINLIYTQIIDSNFHRIEFYYSGKTLIENLSSLAISILNIPTKLNWVFLKDFSKFLIFSLNLILSLILIIKNKNFKLFNLLSIIIIIYSIFFLLNLPTVSKIRNFSPDIIKSFHIEYFLWVAPLIHMILSIYILNEFQNKQKYLKLFFFFCLLYFQINSSLVPLWKKYIIKEINYRNVYTFEEYYMYDDYKKIKFVVGNNKVISIGYDPMIAVMNNMHAIDGYHNIYPLTYKKKFRKIIEKELEKNSKNKKYFDDWGSRVTTFVNDPNNIEIDFQEAKKIGADYVISKYKIFDNNLKEIQIQNLKNKINLYKLK